jgi:hypothetical protein
MGSTYSTTSEEAGCQTDTSGSSSVTDNNYNVNFGFNLKEANDLSLLYSCLRYEAAQKSEDHSSSFLTIIWRCSHLLALSLSTTTSSSPPNNDTNTIEAIEAHLMQQYPQHLEFINRRCQEFQIIISSSSNALNVASKLSNALRQVILTTNDVEGKSFLEFVSNMCWRHGRGYNQQHTLDFIWTAVLDDSTADNELCSSDVIEFCFETASLLHYSTLPNENGDLFNLQSMEINESREIETEATIVRSLTCSLNEYVKKAREHEHNFAGYGVVAQHNNSNTTSSNNEADDGCISKREFSEWQRKIVPDLLCCSTVRMFEVLFFPPELPPHLSPQNKGCLLRKYDRPFPILVSSRQFNTKTATAMKANGTDLIPITSPVFGSNIKRKDATISAVATTLLSPPIFVFTSISTTKFGEKWCRLYAGAEDGWTFQKLEHAIIGYDGPTLLVIKASSKQQQETVTLGAYTAAKWERNKRDFFGLSDCFLFQLVPTLRVLKSLPKMGTRGGHYMYFHSTTNTHNVNPSKKDELAEGLGFGGTVRHPRLFVDCHLEECRASSQDTSFEEGHIGVTPSADPFSSTFSPSGGASTSSKLHIESLEVYAVGDYETIKKGFQAQNHYRDISDATLRNARTVDKAAFLGDMRNNGVVENKTFAHRGQVDGRAAGCLKDDGKSNGL